MAYGRWLYHRLYSILVSDANLRLIHLVRHCTATFRQALQLCRGPSSSDWFYMFASSWMSRSASFAQSLHYSERSSHFDGPFLLVLTSKTPRRAHSAIRAQEGMPPAHEISCARSHGPEACPPELE